MKQFINNLFLICYPLLLLLDLFIVSLLVEPFQKNQIGIFPLLLTITAYSFLFIGFIIMFIYERPVFNNGCWLIGLIELLISLLCLLFNDLWNLLSNLLYVNIGLSSLMLISSIVLYGVILYLGKKKDTKMKELETSLN